LKRLNFYPYYEEMLRSRIKTTTFRLSKGARFKEDDEVMISLGWDEKKAIDLHKVRIKMVYFRRIRELNDFDFEGESPDCKSQESTRLVLGCIYKTILTLEDEICVIKFKHI
jgi:hypothetical protein